MHPTHDPFTRRAMLRFALAGGALALFAPGAFAEQLEATPRLTEGPFYPYNKLPLDRDNDLILVGDSLTPAVGEVTHLGGRLLDNSGSPIKDAVIEIWQCDAKGVYLAQGDTSRRDRNFQGYGKFTTGSTGEYRFRTIKPVEYSGRPAPHIHFKLSKGNRELITTQCFIAGYPGNARDGIFNDLRDPIERELVSVDFKPVEDSKAKELTATFDIVLGRTPVDRDHH